MVTKTCSFTYLITSMNFVLIFFYFLIISCDSSNFFCEQGISLKSFDISCDLQIGHCWCRLRLCVRQVQQKMCMHLVITGTSISFMQMTQGAITPFLRFFI